MHAEPLHVALQLAPPLLGGVSSFALNYYRHLDHSRFKVDLLVHEQVPDSLLSEIESQGGRIIQLPTLRRHPIGLVLALYRVLKAGSYDILHVNWNTLNILFLFPAWLARVPVRFSHAHSSSDPRDGRRHCAKCVLRPFSGLFATHFLACSRRAGEFQFGVRRRASGKVALLPNAIEPARFAFSESARHGVRQELGLSESAWVIGHIGRLGTPKNQAFLIEVFAQVRRLRPEAVLLLVGDGPDRPELERLAERLCGRGGVVFAGSRSDAFRFYSAFDVFCLTSFYEGLPVVLVEAQANGVPCLISDGVTRESALTDLVDFLPLETQRWVSELARRRARPATPPTLPSAYDIQHAAKSLERIYESACAR